MRILGGKWVWREVLTRRCVSEVVGVEINEDVVVEKWVLRVVVEWREEGIAVAAAEGEAWGAGEGYEGRRR